MNPFRSLLLIFLLTILIMFLSACGASTAIAPNATSVPSITTSTEILPTDTPIPPTDTPIPATDTPNPPTATNELALPPGSSSDFLFNPSNFEVFLVLNVIPPGQSLDFGVIDSYLANGSLEIVLPTSEKKIFQNVPAPQGQAGSLENYSDKPSGPGILIHLDQLLDKNIKGSYQISWRSGNLDTGFWAFDWNGTQFTLHKP